MKYRDGRASTIWRAIVIALMVAVTVLALAVVLLFNVNHTAIERGDRALENDRALACRVGGFLVGTPIIRQPGINERVFRRQIEKVREFLVALRVLACNGLGHVTTAIIARQQKALQRATPAVTNKQGGGGG